MRILKQAVDFGHFSRSFFGCFHPLKDLYPFISSRILLHEDYACRQLIGTNRCRCFRTSRFWIFFLVFWPTLTSPGPLRQGWVFLERTRILSGIQFTKYFTDFVFVKTNQSISSNPHVICPQETFCQRSNVDAGSKRRALTFYFSVRICYMMLRSNCRGE